MRKMNISPNFTPRAQKAISSSKRIAYELNNKEVLPVHLLIAILETRQFAISAILESLSIDPLRVSMVLQELCAQKSKVVSVDYAEEFKEKIKDAHRYASKLKN